jgi:hypothetical protein
MPDSILFWLAFGTYLIGLLFLVIAAPAVFRMLRERRRPDEKSVPVAAATMKH